MAGWILASALGLFGLFYLVAKKKDASNRRALLESRSESVKSIATTNGECRSDNSSDADVIIVGAGVAGSALAHTLGKVIYLFLFCFSFLLCFLSLHVSRTKR